MIMDAIASQLVLPNRLTVPLVADLHVAQLRSPLPRVTPFLLGLEKHGSTQTDANLSNLISKFQISIKGQTQSLVVHEITRELYAFTCWRPRT